MLELMHLYLARMRKGYGSCCVCASVYLCYVSITALAAIYLVYKSGIRCYKVP